MSKQDLAILTVFVSLASVVVGLAEYYMIYSVQGAQKVEPSSSECLEHQIETGTPIFKPTIEQNTE